MESIAIFFPLQILLFRREQRAITQALAGIAGHTVLDRSEKAVDEMLFLIGQVLPDAVGNGDRALLQLDYRQRDPVDVDHQIRPLGVGHDDRDLFRHGEVVFPRLVKVEEVHRYRLTVLVVHLSPVFQERIDLLIGIVQALTQIIGGSL